MKNLVAYNICGISNNQSLERYIDRLESITSQSSFKDNYELVISSCLSDDNILSGLKDHGFNVFEIKDKVPVNVSFNNTCIKAKEIFNTDFDSYIYIDSGIKLTDPHSLDTLSDQINQGDSAMVCGMIDNDMDLDFWNLDIHGDKYVIPVGKATNLHFQAFSKELVDYYNRPMPDIFASFCTESTFSFMCAALQKNWTVMSNVFAEHEISMDGRSSGFSPEQAHIERGTTADHPFVIDSIFDRIVTEDGYNLGFGYEECRSIMVHDSSKYDENGHCKNDELKEWIKNNLFLSKEEFDYEKMNWEVVGSAS